MADATTTSGSVTVDGDSASAVDLEKKKAMEVMTENVRNLLSFTLKIPGGSPLLKKLHTNSFIWTELPERFRLENFPKIVDAMKGEYTRYAGYVLDRWYVEGLTITHDSSGLWFELTLNPFPSPNSTYANILKSAQDAYVSATTQNTTTTTSTTSNTVSNIPARTDGKTDCSTTLSLVCGHGSISSLRNKAESTLAQGRIGREGTNYAKAVQGMTGKEAYKFLCQRIPMSSPFYYDNPYYKCASDAYDHPNNLNCAERARLLKSCMDIVGQPCVIYHVPGHYMNGVLLNGTWETVDLCYRSGKIPAYQTAGWHR